MAVPHRPPPRPGYPPFPLPPPVSHAIPALRAPASNGSPPGPPAKRSASRHVPHHLSRVAAPVVESAVATTAAAAPAETAEAAPAAAALGVAAARPSHRLCLRPFPFPSPSSSFPSPSFLPVPFLPFGTLFIISTWPRGAPYPIAQPQIFQDPPARPEHRLFFSSHKLFELLGFGGKARFCRSQGHSCFIARDAVHQPAPPGTQLVNQRNLLLTNLVQLMLILPFHLHHFLHFFPMYEIPRSYRSSRCLIVFKATWHVDDKLLPSPRRLLNTDIKLLRIAPVRYIVFINP